MTGKKTEKPTAAALWYRLSRDGNALCIFVHTQPNARTTDVVGLHDGRLKIRVAAPALDGRANTLLIEFLRRRLDLPVQRIALTQGACSRGKTIEIAQPSVQLLAELDRLVAA